LHQLGQASTKNIENTERRLGQGIAGGELRAGRIEKKGEVAQRNLWGDDDSPLWPEDHADDPARGDAPTAGLEIGHKFEVIAMMG
jgi:hypothetical protein